LEGGFGLRAISRRALLERGERWALTPNSDPSGANGISNPLDVTPTMNLAGRPLGNVLDAMIDGNHCSLRRVTSSHFGTAREDGLISRT